MTLEASLSIPVPLHLVAEPPETASDGNLGVLIALHGYAMDAASMLAVLRKVAPPGFLLVALEGPHSAFQPGTEGGPDIRSGFHWGVSPRHEENRATHRAAVAAAVEWALAEGGDPERVSLLGFSQPCSFNYRLALAPPHGRPFRALVALCGGVPGEWKGAEPGTPASSQTDVLHVSTREDSFYPLERVATFRERLAARFRSAEHLLFDGPHRIPSAAHEPVRAFLSAKA